MSAAGARLGAEEATAERRPRAGAEAEALLVALPLAAVIIVAVSAAATASGVLLYVDSIANDSDHNNHLHDKLKNALAHNDHGGEPREHPHPRLRQTRRGEFEEDPGRSDTTMLLRIDPDQDSDRGDLDPARPQSRNPRNTGPKSSTPPTAYGGPKLTLQVVKELTGLKINHVVNVDFLGFVRAVDAIGCVYTDVDRRYYHSNEGLPASEQYSEINIQPGYQLLCGKKALEYVRYRHTDTDIVRSARQQSSSATPAARSRSTTCSSARAA